MQKFSITDNLLLKTFIFHYSLQRFSINQNNDKILAVSGNGLLLYSDIPTTITRDSYIQTIFSNSTTGNIILNSNGVNVFTQNYEFVSDNISIDVSGYSRGVYFISVENSNRVLQTYKFIKE